MEVGQYTGSIAVRVKKHSRRKLILLNLMMFITCAEDMDEI